MSSGGRTAPANGFSPFVRERIRGRLHPEGEISEVDAGAKNTRHRKDPTTMAIRSLHSLHLIKDPVRGSPSPQHEPDAKSYSAAPLRQDPVFETLTAAHRAQWRGLALARLLHRNLHALHSMT